MVPDSLANFCLLPIYSHGLGWWSSCCLEVLDFAGGIVAHSTAGFAALSSVYFVGARKERKHIPNNIPLVADDTALLWFCWYGFNTGIECYLAVRFKEEREWDDAHNLWGVHGMGGVIGTICLGLFATKSINSSGVDGLFYGGGITFLLKQIAAILLAVVYGFFFTLYLLKVINKLVPVKASLKEEKEGLDISYHGEVARDLS